MADGKIIGFVMTLPEVSSTWMFCGTTPTEVAETVKHEVSGMLRSEFDKIDAIRIEPRLFTQDEIDNMPDFPGW